LTGICTSVTRIASGEQGACRCSYLVRMIKPNSITSHDWHVQPICQRSFRVDRLSGLFGSRPGLLRQGVLELVALADCTLPSCRLHFCANLLNLSNFHLHVKLNLFPRFRTAQTRCWRFSPACEVQTSREEISSFSKVSHSAKYQSTTSNLC